MLSISEIITQTKNIFIYKNNSNIHLKKVLKKCQEDHGNVIENCLKRHMS